MSWYYAKDNAQAGPVDEVALSELARSGTITPETLIWKQGMANWMPYSTVGGSSAASIESIKTRQCDECGQPFPPDQLITVGGRTVCGTCKPVALQKFQEGVMNFGRTVDAEELWRIVEQRGYHFTIGSVVSRSWTLVAGNFWPCLGVTLLCYLILIGSSQIPLVSLVATFLVQPQILAGLYCYFLKQFRGEKATLNDAFEGFRRGFGQQAIYMLIVFGVMLACILPLALIIPLVSISSDSGNSSELTGIIVVAAMLIALPVGYFMLCWIFAPALILDKSLKATAAMKLSRRAVHMRFWKILGFLLVVGLLCLLSLLALIVGIFVMLPFAFAMIARLYEDIFGEGGAGAAT